MRRQLLWTVISCAAIVWAGTQSWAFQEDAPEDVGLTGIILAYAPEGLTEDDFAALAEQIDETWKDWVLETGQLVNNFYEGENNTIEAQRSALNDLKVKVRTMEKALADSRYRSIHAQIGELHARLAPRVEMSEAILNTLTLSPEQAAQRRSAEARTALNQALQQFREDMNSVTGGRAWLSWAMFDQLKNFSVDNEQSIAAAKAVQEKFEKREEYGDEIREFMSRESFLSLEDAVRESLESIQPVNFDVTRLRDELVNLLDAIDEYNDTPYLEQEAALHAQIATVSSVAPDGGQTLQTVFDKYYRNDNFRLSITEGFLNRVIGDSRRESTGINDRALGARIVGTQTSDVTVSVDVQPNDSQARFQVNLTGTISSNSTAYTSEATIRSVGRHSLSASKAVTFDGNRFVTEPARVNVRSNNQPVAASTRYSGGLFSRYAEKVAMREANARRGQANAYSQRNIQGEVSASLNQEVDEQFANASMELQNRLYGKLRGDGLYPNRIRTSSTNNEIRYQSLLLGSNQTGGGPISSGAVPPPRGMLIQIHQTLLTNALKEVLRGEGEENAISEDVLAERLKDALQEVLGRELNLGMGDDESAESEEDPTKLIFELPNALRFSIDDGEIALIMRAGLDRDGNGVLDNGGDDIQPHRITVPLVLQLDGEVLHLKYGPREHFKAQPLGSGGIQGGVLRSKIESRIKEQELKSTFEFKQGEKKVSMQLMSIDANNGWLTLTLQ